MKKFLSILLALTLVLSLGITAFAAEDTGSITITNATIGNSYSLYKIFDATYSTDANGNGHAARRFPKEREDDYTKQELQTTSQR